MTLRDEFVEFCSKGEIYKAQSLLYKVNNKGWLNNNLILDDIYINKGLLKACKYGHFDVVKMLINDSYSYKKITKLFDCLILSCKYGYINISRYLLMIIDHTSLSTTEICKMFDVSCEGGSLTIIKLLIATFKDMPSNDWLCKGLAVACKYGHLHIVKYLLLDRKIDASKIYEYFMLACINGHKQVVEFLLTPDSSIPIININYQDEKVFIESCKNNQVEIVKILLSINDSCKINVHAKKDKALILSCKYDCDPMIRFLLDLSGDRKLNIHTKHDRCFYIVCSNNNLKLAKLFLSFTDDRYISLACTDNCYESCLLCSLFTTLCGFGYCDMIALILRKRKIEKYVLDNIESFTRQLRMEIFIIILKHIRNKRRKQINNRMIFKCKRIFLRELKSLPYGYLYNNFPGGSDYLKLVDIYRDK